MNAKDRACRNGARSKLGRDARGHQPAHPV